MDHSTRVRRHERIGDLQSEIERAFDAQRPSGQDGREVLSLDVLHDDVRMGVDVEHVVDGRDVGVGETAGRGRFTVQTLARVGSAEKRGRRTLEGDAAPQPSVFGEIDLAHSPAAHALHDGVRANPLTDQSPSSLCRVSRA